MSIELSDGASLVTIDIHIPATFLLPLLLKLTSNFLLIVCRIPTPEDSFCEVSSANKKGSSGSSLEIWKAYL